MTGVASRRARRRTALVGLAVSLVLSAVPVTGPAALADPEKPSGPAPAGTTDPFNSRLAVQVAPDATFNIGAFPNPLTGGATAGSFSLTYQWPGVPGSSFSTIRVDGVDTQIGSGTAVSAPTDVDAVTNRSEWAYGDIGVTQTLQLVQNPLTGLVDAAAIRYRLANNGSGPHAVGLRVMQDTSVNGNDGSPFRLPGVGPVTTEQDFLGAAVPESFLIFQDLSDTQHVGAATLRNLSTADPDRLAIAWWPSIAGTAFDYTVTPGASVTDDSAYALFWNPAALAPGASREYTSLLGLGTVDVDLSGALALGVDGPAALAAQPGGYTPNPFTVTATVENVTEELFVNGVTATVNLPAGLALTSGPAAMSLGTLTPGQTATASWSVTAAPRPDDATLTYSVTLTGVDFPAKTVSRTVFVPGLPTFAFSAPTYSVGEAGPNALINITRTGGTARSATVTFSTADGSATAGSDYTAVSSPVPFPIGQTMATVAIPIIDDTAVEPAETVALSLSNPQPGFVGTPATATLTIVDNDVAPTTPTTRPRSRPRQTSNPGPSRASSGSSNCSGGSSCTVRLVGRDEVFDITAQQGRSAKLKGKLNGGDEPKCQGSGQASREWAQFEFTKGGEDRPKGVVIYVRDLDDDEKYNWFVQRQNICAGAPYPFTVEDGFRQTRDRKGEFLGMLPDCRDLQPGFDNNDWWGRRVESPCVGGRELTRKWDETVVKITLYFPANALDPRVRRDV